MADTLAASESESSLRSSSVSSSSGSEGEEDHPHNQQQEEEAAIAAVVNNHPITQRARGGQSSVPSSPSAPSSSVPNTVSLWSPIIRLLSFPLNFLIGTLFRIARFTIDLIRADPGSGYDPIIEVESFISEFESTFGTSHPIFHRGSYDQAVTQAKRELRFLLVYLHSPGDPDSEDFVRDVLTYTAVVQYITRNNLIFWSCSTRSYEGYKVSQALRESSSASLIAVIVQKEEGLMRLVRRIDISRSSGTQRISVERFLSTIDRTISENESFIRVAREDRAARAMNQEIRRQQDQDYEESLAEDRRKEKEKADEKRKRDEEERLKQEAKIAAIRRREQLAQLRKQMKQSLPPEPGMDQEDVVKIVIKLPDGNRLERRFSQSDSIKSLYQFVYSDDASPFSFQIVSNFPRKELPGVSPLPENPDCLINGKTLVTFKEAGLGKNELLFVHDLEA